MYMLLARTGWLAMQLGSRLCRLEGEQRDYFVRASVIRTSLFAAASIEFGREEQVGLGGGS